MQDTASDFPPVFLERLQKIVPPSAWPETLRSFKTPRPVVFRIHKPGVEAQALAKDLAGEGIRARPVAWMEGAFLLEDGDKERLQASRAYRENQIYIQGLSSLMPARALGAQPGERVLDMAAAPGSKATQIALMMKGEGELVANEKVRPRFFHLKANVERQGLGNVRVTLKPGQWFGHRAAGSFDRVLLDAPCSSEGRFEAAEPDSWRYWSVRKIREMQSKQKGLLKSALMALKPGGVLVYATCTFAPEENEAVLDWAFRKMPEEMEMLAPELPMPNLQAGLQEWEGKSFHPEVAKARRILPTQEMEAFFIAAVRRRV